jgi:hypothetical protein
VGTPEHGGAAAAAARAKTRPGIPVLIIIRNPAHSVDAVVRECEELLEGVHHQVKTGGAEDGSSWVEVTVDEPHEDSGDMTEPPIML